jgi:phosphate starvation-inducible PhoH-like protein
MRVLRNIDDIAICELTGADVVRHQLVQKIIEAYEGYEKKPAPAQKKPAPAKKTGRKPREA